MSIDEKAELVFQAYVDTLDFDIALSRVVLSEDELAMIMADETLMVRMRNRDYEVQAELLHDLRALKDSTENEQLQFQCIVKLGEMLYSKRFKPVEDKKEVYIVPDQIVLLGAEEKSA